MPGLVCTDVQMLCLLGGDGFAPRVLCHVWELQEWLAPASLMTKFHGFFNHDSLTDTSLNALMKRALVIGSRVGMGR